MRSTLIVWLVILIPAGDARGGPLGRRIFGAAPPAYARQEPVYYAPSEPPPLAVIQPAGAVAPAGPVYPLQTAYPVATPEPAGVPFPILAAFALASGPSWAPGAPPPLGSGQPLYAGLPRAVSWTLTVFTYLGVPYSPIGIAVPRAIRTAHVLLNGSPYPDRPVQTVYWIAFTLAAQFTDRVRERGGLFGRRGRAAGPGYYDLPDAQPAVYYSPCP